MRLTFDIDNYPKVYNALVKDLGFKQDIFLTDEMIEIYRRDYDKVKKVLPEVDFEEVEYKDYKVEIAFDGTVAYYVCAADREEARQKACSLFIDDIDDSYNTQLSDWDYANWEIDSVVEEEEEDEDDD